MNYRRVRTGVFLLLVGVLIAGCAAVWIPDPLVGIAEMYRPDVVYRAPRATGMIALTIDDGPHPDTTSAILDVLDRHGVWATFFLLGENARTHPELVETIRDRGHEIGNHLMRDEKSVSLGREIFARDLARADSILAIEGPKLLRPGSGWFAGWMLEEAEKLGYRCILASAYVQDTRVRKASVIAWLLKNQTHAGDIVVLHEGRPDRSWAPEVLDELIPYWQSKGWVVGSVGDLLAKSRSPRG